MNDTGETVARMKECLCRWERAGDGRAVFLACYAQMTDNMVAAAVAGEFHDRAWVSRLLVRFAGYYFHSLEAYEAGAEVPKVWVSAFEVAAQPGAPVLSQLLLGVNAHINYDLVFALADLLEAEWEILSPEARQKRREDYDHVNKIIGRTINAVQDTVIERREPVLAALDVLLGPVDEWLVTQEIARWRDRIWDEAVRRVELAGPESREEHRQEVESSALVWVGRLGGG